MPYSKEQLRKYWRTHKDQLNLKRREKRRLAKFGLAIPGQVSQKLAEVSHEIKQVSHQPKTANPTANPPKVSHGKPENGKPHLEMANLKLAQLIQEWQTQTNYNCVLGCSVDKYCSNC